MRLGKDLVDKPIYSITEGRLVGKVKDLYLDSNLERIAGFYLCS
ncbi:MAG: PRC-barrel domain-containing protein, partial [Chloroflexi bacterium]|nr:PRC-barrel domain-containing protein [Chloroflexota bacterium]